MNINSIINEEIEIFEGYKEVDDLSRLADDIISYFASHNWNMLQQIATNGKFTVYNLSPYDAIQELNIIVKSINKTTNIKAIKKYSESILNFIIDFPVNIYFTPHIDTGGNYHQINKENKRGGLIAINTRIADFLNKLKQQNIFKKPYNPSEYKTILKISMMNNVKENIVHELQHAYDDYRSEGKYEDDPLSKKYYSGQKQNSNAEATSEKKKKNLLIYLKLPHEYWARFSQTLSTTPNNIDKNNFNQLFDYFKKKFIGYKSLPEDDKRRILNSLYKYYDLRKDLIKRGLAK